MTSFRFIFELNSLSKFDLSCLMGIQQLHIAASSESLLDLPVDLHLLHNCQPISGLTSMGYAYKRIASIYFPLKLMFITMDNTSGIYNLSWLSFQIKGSSCESPIFQHKPRVNSKYFAFWSAPRFIVAQAEGVKHRSTQQKIIFFPCTVAGHSSCSSLTKSKV